MRPDQSRPSSEVSVLSIAGSTPIGEQLDTKAKDESRMMDPIDSSQVGADAKLDEHRPKIIAFLCRWCSYAGADLAGSSRIKYPADIRIIRVPCSCRVDPNLVIRSLQQGADGVLVSGCHPGDCHYTSGNYNARRRMLMLKELLTFVGLDPRRVQMSWVSASEGSKWAQVVADVTKEIKQLGANGHVGGNGASHN